MNNTKSFTTEDINNACIPLLHEINELLEKSSHTPDVLNPVLMMLADQFALIDVAITLFDQTSKEIYIDTSYGMSPLEQTRGRYQLGEGIIGEVVQSKEKIIVPDINTEPRFLNKTRRKEKYQLETSFICVPIIENQLVAGTLSVSLPFHLNTDLSTLATLITIIASLLIQPIILKRKLLEAKNEIEQQLEKQHYFREIDTKLLISRSNKMRVLKQKIFSLPDLTPILISGETGTGKTFIANLIHESGQFKHSSIIQYNASIFSRTEHIQQLFGKYAKAFSIPDVDADVHLETFEDPILLRVQNKTLLVEDIEAIPIDIQTYLFNIIQSPEIFLHGKNQKISIRYIFTSQLSKEDLQKENLLLPSLYQLFANNYLHIPPLRERREDIIMFADNFLTQINSQLQVQEGAALKKRISTPAIDLLNQYHWPGNLNELYTVIESACQKSREGVLHAHMFPPSIQSAKSTNTQNTLGLHEAVERLEKDLIIDVLKTTSGHLKKSAQILKISERILGLRIKKYNITPKSYR